VLPRTFVVVAAAFALPHPRAVAESRPEDTAEVASSCLDEEVTADSLNERFENGVGDMIGADYQRAFELADGRVLWVFQDAVFADGADGTSLVHNGGAIQDGMCFETLASHDGGLAESWVAADDTQPFTHWYWPLDGYQHDDDTFVLFLAEMAERGNHYLDNATPVATRTVEIDLATLDPGPLARAPNPGTDLYGFEVNSDGEYHYLYAQCHRQFGFGLVGHDSCASEVRVARLPIDEPDWPLEYWDGATWTRNSRRAINIAPVEGPDGEPRNANPMQIERDGDRWIAVTKVGDWWGNAVHFDVAPNPEGPWTTTAVVPVTAKWDPSEIASYFVSFVPTHDDGHTIAISNNRWDGEFSDVYHPHFDTVSDWLWAERHASRIRDDLWIPIGDPIA
jgi:hypothetical protein